MIARAGKSDIESNYRMHWLLHDSLECYFKMRDLWYLGPKESFKWLKTNAPLAYHAFELALKPHATNTKIRHLIEIILNIND